MPPLQGDIPRRDFELCAFGPVNRVELIHFAGENCRASNRRSHSTDWPLSVMRLGGGRWRRSVDAFPFAAFLGRDSEEAKNSHCRGD
jgi:hypothetical protein